MHLRKWKAACVRDNLDRASKEGSQRLALCKADACYFGSLEAWRYLSKKFFMRKSEKQRVYDINNLESYLNIPDKYK